MEYELTEIKQKYDFDNISQKFNSYTLKSVFSIFSSEDLIIFQVVEVEEA